MDNIGASTSDNIDIEFSSTEEATGFAQMQWEENYDDIGEFFFESDHLALKGNTDYHNLLKTMAMLEAQQAQAIRDLDVLHKGHQEALSDPLNFVKRLQKKEPMNFPKRQRVAELPTINWNKYALKEGDLPPLLKRTVESNKTDRTEKDEGDKVRGRSYDPSKPVSFNQLWTSQEQKKLEELLVLYPPEEVEYRRWEKISKALGTRTPAQVASRVQKYFIHLSKAGLAVPGRAPRRHTLTQSGRGGAHRVTMLRMTSSFFKHHMPSVYMMDTQEMEDIPGPSSTPQNAFKEACMDEDEDEDDDDDDDDNDGLAKSEMLDNPVYQELLYLQKLRQEKAKKQGQAQHLGFKCDRCQCDPIVGTRWHCVDCLPEKSVDFCSDCVGCQMETQEHKASHQLQAISKSIISSAPFLDGDYLHLMGPGQYCNYLDPNYMPASSASV